MKDATLQILITARALLEQAERHCSLGDRYLATAGLIVLQDSVELVFLAVLIEKDVDEDRQIEKLTFDEMIAAIAQLGFKVPKSGTLRAMNKLRVTAKHYGQIMEPATVQGHLNASKTAIDAVLTSCIGRPLREVLLTELVGNTASRPFLDQAITSLKTGNYLDALIATRKAFFLEFEQDYCIYRFRDRSSQSPIQSLGLLTHGWKAYHWTQNQQWISLNVKTPYDYVQINPENARIDAMEWGINTQILQNIRRLTPVAVQLEVNGEWYVRYPAAYVANNANRENAAVCLDLTIDAVRRKHEHIRAARTGSRERPFDMPAAYISQPIYERPDRASSVLSVLTAEDRYMVHEILTGFDPKLTFYQISCMRGDQTIVGYVEKNEQQPLSQTTQS